MVCAPWATLCVGEQVSSIATNSTKFSNSHLRYSFAQCSACPVRDLGPTCKNRVQNYCRIVGSSFPQPPSNINKAAKSLAFSRRQSISQHLTCVICKLVYFCDHLRGPPDALLTPYKKERQANNLGSSPCSPKQGEPPVVPD